MVIECEKCGSMFNNKTVPKCPACNFREPKRIDMTIDNNKTRKAIKYQERKDITDFRMDIVREMKKKVSSQRKSDVSKYERQTGKKVY